MRIEKPYDALRLGINNAGLISVETGARITADYLTNLNVDAVSSSLLDVKDFIKQVSSGSTTNSLGFSTTSTSYVDVTGATLTFNKRRSDTLILLFVYVMGYNSNSSYTLEVGHVVDGSGLADTMVLRSSTNNEYSSFSRISGKNGISSGSHTIQLRMKTSNVLNTATLQSYSMTAIEVPQ